MFKNSLILTLSLIWAEGTGSPPATPTRLADQAPPPLISTTQSCINRPEDIQKITAGYKQFKDAKTRGDREKKYDEMKKAFSERRISPQEVFARLVYAETLAAKCSEHFPTIMPIVAGVIKNRIDLRDGQIAPVVWQYDQFASSVNINDYSQYQDFLCPDFDSPLWQTVKNVVGGLLTGTLPNRTPKAMTSYYFFQHYPPHSRYYKKHPEWTRTYQRLKILVDGTHLSQEVQDCFGAFHNPYFK